jgi:hypothetical protein
MFVVLENLDDVVDINGAMENARERNVKISGNESLDVKCKRVKVKFMLEQAMKA